VAMHITVAWKDLETLSLKILNETEERIFKNNLLSHLLTVIKEDNTIEKENNEEY
jgi:hypothetical protein